MESPVVKRSVVIAGHKTSISLEDAFWKSLREIAHARDMTPSELVTAIDTDRQHTNLSSAIRLFVLCVYRDQLVGHDQIPSEGSAHSASKCRPASRPAPTR
jgi:predicted DNA-binding ribbon-helix-helix protein